MQLLLIAGRKLSVVHASDIAWQTVLSVLRSTVLRAGQAYGHHEADSVRRLALQALTALATNDQLKFTTAGDGATFLHAVGSLFVSSATVGGSVAWDMAPNHILDGQHIAEMRCLLHLRQAHIELKSPPMCLPSASTFNAAHFLLMGLLRQRAKVGGPRFKGRGNMRKALWVWGRWRRGCSLLVACMRVACMREACMQRRSCVAGLG